jgi:adenine-specific DNA-methyltransferase
VYSSSSNSSNPHPGGYTYDIIHPITGLACPKPQNGWRWPYSTFDAYDKAGEIEWGKDNTTQPHVKKRIESATDYLRTLIYEDNRGTTLALAEMFNGEKVFDNPKPIKTLQRILDFASYKSATILDFFAGSGSTLHATMNLNADDGGKRQCILVTNNENNICEEVTYIRNKKVIEGYTTPKGEEVAGLKSNTLRYYKTDFIPRKRTIKNMRALVSASTDLLCIKNNVYTEQQIFGGHKLKPEAARYFDDGKTKMLVIYNELGVDAFASMLRTMDVEGKIKVYVFSNNRYAYTDNFVEVLDKVELCALPAAIYDAYNAVLKPIKNDDDAGDLIIDDNESKENDEQGLFNFSEEGGER